MTPGSILSDKDFASLGVCKTLQEACARLEWKTASQIQAEVLPEALQGRDIIGLAETGKSYLVWCGAVFSLFFANGFLTFP